MKKKHAFFHTLVISSVSVIEGCGLSHGGTHAGPDSGPLPDVNPVDTRDAQARRDAAVFDAGPMLDVMVVDAGPNDAGRENPDANIPDAGPDVFATDASVAHRFCAPGWPPTKGIRVCQIFDEEGVAVLRCAYTFGEDMEPDWERSNVCNAGILGEDDDRWFIDMDGGVPAEYVGCSPVETDSCRLADEGGRQLLVCADATCELTEGFIDGIGR